MAIAVLKDDGLAKETNERHKYRSGRLYFPGFVQSFEVHIAESMIELTQ